MYSSANLPVQSPRPLAKSDSPEIIASAESNGKVQQIPASLRHIPDSTESPGNPLDKRQVTTQTSCVVKVTPEKSPTMFRENDLLLVYPYNSRDRDTPGFDLQINPEKIKNRLDFYITEFLRNRWIEGKREDGPTDDETKSLADSILARLPAELTEFLNKDWCGKKVFAPEEYQALARFHSAMILAKHERINSVAFLSDEECEDLNEYIIKNIPLRIVWRENDEEFHEFFKKECIPLRNGWNLDEIKIIKSWLNCELKKHIKTCHYGILKAGCVTLCDQCRYSVTENWQAYERLKMFMRQKQKLS